MKGKRVWKQCAGSDSMQCRAKEGVAWYNQQNKERCQFAQAADAVTIQ